MPYLIDSLIRLSAKDVLMEYLYQIYPVTSQFSGSLEDFKIQLRRPAIPLTRYYKDRQIFKFNALTKKIPYAKQMLNGLAWSTKFGLIVQYLVLSISV